MVGWSTEQESKTMEGEKEKDTESEKEEKEAKEKDSVKEKSPSILHLLTNLPYAYFSQPK